MRQRQQPPQDPVGKAHERARHLNGALKNLLDRWKVSPGLPELRDRLQALAPVGQEMEEAVTAATDVPELLETRREIGNLVSAVLDIRRDEAIEGLHVLRNSILDLLTSAYELEQVLDIAEREEVSVARM
jgi:hypothetical protein